MITAEENNLLTQRAEHFICDVQARDDPVLLRDDAATQRRASRHNAVRGDIARADVLLQSTAYAMGNIEGRFGIC